MISANGIDSLDSCKEFEINVKQLESTFTLAVALAHELGDLELFFQTYSLKNLILKMCKESETFTFSDYALTNQVIINFNRILSLDYERFHPSLINEIVNLRDILLSLDMEG